MTRGPHPNATRKGFGAAFRRNALVWAGLMALLAASVGLVRLPAGPWTGAIPIAIAGLQAALIAGLSMGLAKSPALNRFAAAIGLVFVLVLFTLTLADLFTRI